MDPDELVKTLDRSLSASRKHLTKLDLYLEGEQPLKYMAPALQQELGERITQVVINWPELVTDAYETRLDVVGFRYPGSDEDDEGIWDLWQDNDGDEQSQQAHHEALGLGRSYVVVGTGDDGETPLITVEHPFQMATHRDPRTRQVDAAIKRWSDTDRKQMATLYLPDATITYRKESRRWVVDERDDHKLGAVPVVPIVNRPRLLRPDGRSEFASILTLADAANKMATDMMVSGEFHAVPRRWVFGMSEEDFVDKDGNKLSTWQNIIGRIWATENHEAKAGQFAETDLANFHNTLRELARLVVQIAALPPHYAGFTTDNPASADAIRASEAQLVKRCERKQTTLSGAWEQVIRLALRIRDNEWNPEARRLETRWRDPATPTLAQVADAQVKLVQQGIIPVEFAREQLGYTAAERKRMAEMDRAALARVTGAGSVDLVEILTGIKPDAPADPDDLA